MYAAPRHSLVLTCLPKRSVQRMNTTSSGASCRTCNDTGSGRHPTIGQAEGSGPYSGTPRGCGYRGRAPHGHALMDYRKPRALASGNPSRPSLTHLLLEESVEKGLLLLARRPLQTVRTRPVLTPPPTSTPVKPRPKATHPHRTDGPPSKQRRRPLTHSCQGERERGLLMHEVCGPGVPSDSRRQAGPSPPTHQRPLVEGLHLLGGGARVDRVDERVDQLLILLQLPRQAVQ
jgi:hypothetical protein